MPSLHVAVKQPCKYSDLSTLGSIQAIHEIGAPSIASRQDRARLPAPYRNRQGSLGDLIEKLLIFVKEVESFQAGVACIRWGCDGCRDAGMRIQRGVWKDYWSEYSLEIQAAG